MPLDKHSRVHSNLTLNTRRAHEKGSKIKLVAVREDAEKARDLKIQGQENAAKQFERQRKSGWNKVRESWGGRL
jgi:hypothetical protein